VRKPVTDGSPAALPRKQTAHGHGRGREGAGDLVETEAADSGVMYAALSGHMPELHLRLVGAGRASQPAPRINKLSAIVGQPYVGKEILNELAEAAFDSWKSEVLL
jgi:hypothetical protein